MEATRMIAFSVPQDIAEETAIDTLIALHRGYQWRMSKRADGCRFLCPPEPEAYEATGLNSQMLLDDWHPLAAPDAVICGDWNHLVPRPMTKDIDAYNLLLLTCQTCDLYVNFLGRNMDGGWECRLTRTFASDPPKYTAAHKEARGAISLACCDALKARHEQ